MDNLTKEQRRRNMQHIRSSGTTPEKIVMRELRRRKIYFAKNAKSILGKPDIVFRRKRIAVFIDSDFWHRHPKRFQMPATNVKYWKEKIERNVQRDKKVARQLRKEGWTVIRLWAYDIKHNLQRCVNRMLKALGKPPSKCKQA